MVPIEFIKSTWSPGHGVSVRDQALLFRPAGDGSMID